jgi:hypothetical protein
MKNVTKPSPHNSNDVLKHKQAWGEKFDSNLEIVFLNEETSNGIHGQSLTWVLMYHHHWNLVVNGKMFFREFR